MMIDYLRLETKSLCVVKFVALRSDSTFDTVVIGLITGRFGISDKKGWRKGALLAAQIGPFP